MPQLQSSFGLVQHLAAATPKLAVRTRMPPKSTVMVEIVCWCQHFNRCEIHCMRLCRAECCSLLCQDGLGTVTPVICSRQTCLMRYSEIARMELTCISGSLSTIIFPLPSVSSMGTPDEVRSPPPAQNVTRGTTLPLRSHRL